MRRRWAVVAAAAAGLVGLAAGPASASSSYYLYAGGVYVAYGEFQSYGDHWTVCDMHADGRGAFLEWSVPATGRYGSVWDANGAHNSCGTQNVDIGEGRTVQFRVCLTNNGAVLWSTCGGWEPDTA